MMLDETLVSDVLTLARAGGADFAELFMEDTVNTTLRLHQGEVKDAGGGNLFGAGLRLLYGTRVVYAYTNDVTASGLRELASAVASARGSTGEVERSGAGAWTSARSMSRRTTALSSTPDGRQARETGPDAPRFGRRTGW
ncbi:PmbA/TldA family metallopeptidase [Deinococcus malanensis]|uniref:PmbA/TldA family metallopeptidase n=1 Tax=Deinococcus malanensis TaxID=1706855 RepID=UPI003643BF07